MKNEFKCKPRVVKVGCDCSIKLGHKYIVPKVNKGNPVIAVDAEETFGTLGLSAGFIDFADPITLKRVGACGVFWFAQHAKEVVDDKQIKNKRL